MVVEPRNDQIRSFWAGWRGETYDCSGRWCGGLIAFFASSRYCSTRRYRKKYSLCDHVEVNHIQ
jgi:hypothetical protein